jgi:NAD-dependent SIR2 family protein deacetylase
MPVNSINKCALEKVLNIIREADAIAIFAGAGMSVDSGINSFRGDDGLWTKTISIGGESYNHLDLMSHHAFIESPKVAWEFILNLKEKYERTNPHEGYYNLLSLIKDKEHFIITSNIDEHFLKAGFDENCIFECHGTVNYMQCLDILEREVWLTPEIKTENLQLADLPTCPNCGSICRPNVLLFGDWFWIPIRSTHQQIRYLNWCRKIKEIKKNVVAIEIGAGKTIRTIRNAAEMFASNKHPLIRINPFDFETKMSNHFSIKMNAKEFLMSI